MKMNNLEEIMKMGKAVELMAPGGFVHLSAEQVKNISNIKGINANAGCRGYNMPMDVDELLSFKIVRGGYNPETDTNEFLVE